MTSPSTSDSTSPSDDFVAPDTHQKALAVNLDATSFGSFAEIGAGQEVARWFLQVGAASGTVAKTVSAYDKVVSDDLYGGGTRYVSKPRLEAMLAIEWKSLVHQVGKVRGATTRLFAFADTIAARNFAGTNDCHGWLGVRFQQYPNSDTSDIFLHVNLRDTANLLQQEAVGILGVNLIHALMPTSETQRIQACDLPARLFDNLCDDRIEIDQIVMAGSAFGNCDMKSLHAALARDGRAQAVTISADGIGMAANEFLYKKAVILVPASSINCCNLLPQAATACVDRLRSEIAGNAEVKDIIELRFVVVDPQKPGESPDLGKSAALLTRRRELYRATAFVRRYTQAPLRFAMTLPAIMRLFDEVRDQDLNGRMLEGIAKLFDHDVRVWARPSRREEAAQLVSNASPGWEVAGGGPWITANDLRPAPPLAHLYDYLLASGFLIAMPST